MNKNACHLFSCPSTSLAIQGNLFMHIQISYLYIWHNWTHSWICWYIFSFSRKTVYSKYSND